MNPLVEINLEYERRLEASEERRKHLDAAVRGDVLANEIVSGIERQIAEDVLRDYKVLAAMLGAKGGRARASRMTPAQRSASARKAGKSGGRGRPKATHSPSST